MIGCGISVHYVAPNSNEILGWIGILSGWRQHPDIRISVPAAKALANMDVDEDALYLQRLYLMHPSTRASKHIEADVVFVHGLLGGVFYTWRQRMKNEDPLGLLGKNNKEGKDFVV